ncbi:MAG: Secreted protein [Pedosphaera sp.]|nr:Secreted protein [Pedosphaera sp.]
MTPPLKIKLLVASLVFAAGVLVAFADPPATNPVPLLRAHAHNDYEHKHPLFDALQQGFCSVEADIHLVDGDLLVAHDLPEFDPARTLKSLYLEPLRQRVKQNGGRVYKDGPECILLIDFKTAGPPTYAALREVLKEYSDILSVFRDGKKETNAITVVLTGGYPREIVAADPVRYAVCDGKLPDLEKNPPANLVVWISEDWTKSFKWRGDGPMPEDEKARLKQFVVKAHQQGRRLRFWGAPDQPAVWKELLADDVDLINTDDLKGFQRCFNQR